MVIVGMDLTKMVRHDELRPIPRCSSEKIGVLGLFLISDSFRPGRANICAYQLMPRQGKRYCVCQAHTYSAAKTCHTKRTTIAC